MAQITVKDANGTNQTAALVPNSGNAAPADSLPVVLSTDVTVTGPAAQSVLNTDLLGGAVSGWYDVGPYRAGAIQIIASAGISAGAVFFEQTNDTTNAAAGVPLRAVEVGVINTNPNIAAITIAASTIRMFKINADARYIRVRISTAFTGGTVQAVATLSQQPATFSSVNAQQATAANLNCTATIASGTVTTVSTVSNVAAIAAGTNAIGDVGVQYRATATGGASVVSVMSPATPAATAIKAAAGRLLGWQLQNSSAAIRSVKIWNTAVAGVTLGTTAALWEIDIPAGGFVSLNLEGGIGFATAITYAVTGAKGLTDNTGTLGVNDVSGSFFYA